MKKISQGDWFQTPFCFFKKFYIRQKQVVRILVLIYFGRPQLGHRLKQIYNISDNPEMFSMLIFKKGSGTRFLTAFCG